MPHGGRCTSALLERPVEWMQAGYRDHSLFDGQNARTYRALWVATGLWLMQYYHQTGFPAASQAPATDSCRVSNARHNGHSIAQRDGRSREGRCTSAHRGRSRR